MLRLYLLRHAKSSWKEKGLADFDRPLAPRGRRAAEVLGQALRAHTWLPRRIICSSAVRTLQTLDLILPTLVDAGATPEVLRKRRLYDLMEEDYVDLIREEGGEVASLMLVGHNSAVQSSALALCGMGDPEALAVMEASFPTAALAVIDFNVRRWSDIAEGSGALANFWMPRGGLGG
ncbi:SixA phosphatase family protein [Devosia nitrariae]|uniref:Phosphoglycerate mutase n=1 Tax=Devosia nitrariae TaxID=2071872 RepID=A0ABQ5W8S2_9HYPH|nr:histidine phosphatase family protein [Devosia nitrariae]GLQ56283.1 phosphoglycerate mutase [Devosia nitrariae]